MKVLVIDDLVYRVEEMNPKGTLHELYRLIGCSLVDVVRLTDVIDMWLDDEGLYNSQTVNRLATLLARTYGFTHQPYFGTAVIARCDRNGNTAGLTDGQLAQLETRLALILKS